MDSLSNCSGNSTAEDLANTNQSTDDVVQCIVPLFAASNDYSSTQTADKPVNEPILQSETLQVHTNDSTDIEDEPLGYEKPVDDDLYIASLFGTAPFELQSAESLGRYIRASRDIQAGEVVMKTSAYVFTCCDEFRSRVCAICGHLSPQKMLFKCRCGEAWFCSQQCSEMARQDYGFHNSIECDILRLLHGRDNRLSNDSNSYVRLLLQAYVKRYVEQRTPRSRLEQLPGWSGCSFAGCDMLVNNSQLASKEDKKEAYKIADQLLRLCRKSTRHSDLLVGVDREHILDLYFRFACNNFGHWSRATRCYAHGCYPAASYFNHSCMPSCSRFTDETSIVVRANYPLAVGTELTLCYTYVDLNPRDRRYELKDNYFFDCRCLRCLDDTGVCCCL